MKNVLVTAAAFLAIVGHQGAFAAEAAKPCMTHNELSSVAVALIPTLHKQAVASCKPFLPANAGLIAQSDELAAKYESAASKERVAAGNVIARLFGKDLPPQMNGSAIFPFIEAMLPGMISEKLDAKTCVIANNVWSALAPLPPENIGSTLGAILLAASEDKKADASAAGEKPSSRIDDINICPYIATVELNRS